MTMNANEFFLVGCLVLFAVSLYVADKLEKRSRRKKYEKWVEKNDERVGKYADAIIKLFVDEGKPANPTYMTMEDNLAYINKNRDLYSILIKEEIYREVRHCYSYKLLTDENMSFEDTFKTGRILDYGRCAYYLSEAITYDYNRDVADKKKAERMAREEAEKKRIDDKIFALMDE